MSNAFNPYSNPYSMAQYMANPALTSQYIQPQGNMQGQMPYQANNYMNNNPQQQQQHQENVSWIRVNTLDDVKNITVQPNNTAWVMLQNDPIFAVKTADSMGLCTTDYFAFEKYNPQATVQPVEQQSNEYIESLEKRIERLEKMLNEQSANANDVKPTKSTGNTKSNGDK